ncbi:MAG: aminotransferase class V-fold PLP-dependent enzyme [Candidatus Dormiibacterota bacterium]
MSAAPSEPRHLNVELLRAHTPGCAKRVHLNNAGAGLLSKQTLDTMIEHLRLEATVGGYEAEDLASNAIGLTYANIAELVGGQSDEIALFDNATHAWSAAFYSVAFKPGDRILTGRAEYGSNVLAYLQVAQRTGANVVVVPNDESGQIDTEILESLIDEHTRLIGVSHIPTGGGLINPVAKIGAIARAAGVPFLLDATQSVGQFPVNVQEIGCDILSATGRKFLRGPRGTGFLWVRTALLDRLEPSVAEIGSANWDGHRGFTWEAGARRFGTWEKNYVAVLGLSAAVRQALDLGLAEIGVRATSLGATLRDRLGELPGVSTHDLGVNQCAIVTAQVEGVESREVARALARERINVTTTVPNHTQFDTEDRGLPPLVRLSPHYYNTEEEIDTVVDVMARVARMQG